MKTMKLKSMYFPITMSATSMKRRLGNYRNFVRYASTGVRLWDQRMSNEIRHKIENYWKDKVSKIAAERSFEDGKEKCYVLSMFPYPSGSLHMGHVRVYAISDSVARYYRMNGKYVIHPMGWDAFGLPAENAARERKVDPKKWTKDNISNMRNQLDRMGCLFDWDREIATCDPDYYRWTQTLFLMLYKRGLAYRRQAHVNWDPVDRTVLADEQVDKDGKSWRSGAKVEKKLLNQWFVRTTAFAESLLNGLDDPSLKDWRDIIKMQKHWIGECTGTNIEFELITKNPEIPKNLTLWTDKPEYINSAKFVAISSENFLAKFVEKKISENEKTILHETKARNPFTDEELPIYVTNSIEFPKFRDNYLGIPGIRSEDENFCRDVEISYEILTPFTAEVAASKREATMREARNRRIGGFPVSPKLRDWLISRQRYWGTPIPIIHCDKCGPQTVPENELPVVLPEINRDGDDSDWTTLRDAVSWLETNCPNCGGRGIREADTMDTFVDSCWYFVRYLDSKNDRAMFSTEKAMKFLPVDIYIGGKEHAVLHLYYARFLSHFLHSEGLVPTREPFKQLLVQGMVMGKTRRVKGSGKYLRDQEIEKIDGKLFEKETGNPVVESWDKMSKSKHNGVDPMEMFSEYGADTTRLIILADVAPTSNRNWSTETFPGILNWQTRLWLTVGSFIKTRSQIVETNERNVRPNDEKFIHDDLYMYDSRNYYIKGVNFNMTGSQQLSVAISKMQGLTNSIRKVSKECLIHSREYERAIAAQIIMLAPLAPQFASELWAGFCSAPYHLTDDDTSIRRDLDVLEQQWPKIDMDYNMDLKVFVNSEEIFSLKVPRQILDSMSSDEATELATRSVHWEKFVQECPIVRVRFTSNPGCDASIKFNVQMSRKTLNAKIQQNK